MKLCETNIGQKIYELKKQTCKILINPISNITSFTYEIQLMWHKILIAPIKKCMDPIPKTMLNPPIICFIIFYDKY